MNTIIRISTSLLIQLLVFQNISTAQFLPSPYEPYTANGFVLDNLLVAADEIYQAGAPRDGIPAINRPRFLTAVEAGYLKETEYVIGVERNGIAKAYPVRILSQHEVVNDRFDEETVVVTYSVLCNSGMAFSAEIGGKRTTFGVSGLLFNSGLVLYDRKTESLWPQIRKQAVSGEASGKEIVQLPSTHTTWADWKAKHPQTLVLSSKTGFDRDYSRLPGKSFEKPGRLIFPVSETNKILPLRERVIGIEVDGRYRAYPFGLIRGDDDGLIAENFNGLDLSLHYNREANSAYITDAEGNQLPATTMYWFAWYAFHPDTEIYLLDDGIVPNTLLSMAVVWR